MSNMRTVVTVAVPTVTAFLGLLWYLRYRKHQQVPRRIMIPKGKNNDKGQCVEEKNCSVSRTKKEISESSVLNPDKESQNSVSVPNERGDSVSTGTQKMTTRLDEKKEVVEQMTMKKESVQESTKPPTTNSNRSDKLPSSPDKNDAMTETATKLVAQIISTTQGLGTVSKNSDSVPTEPVCSSPTGDSLPRTETVEDKVNDEIVACEEVITPDNTGSLQCKQSVMTDKEMLSVADEGVNEKQNTQKGDSVIKEWHEEVLASENTNDLSENVSSNIVDSLDGNDELAASTITENGQPNDINKSDTSVHNGSSLKSRTDVTDISNSSSTNSSNTENKTHLTNHNNNQTDISNCENLSQASSDSDLGSGVKENGIALSANNDSIYEFNIPSDMCGLFIGTRGKTIKMISQQSGTKIRLQNNPYARNFQICSIEGSKKGIDTACDIIKKKFPSITFPGIDVNAQPPTNPVIIPEIMQLSLPDGVSVDIVVSSIVDGGRLFVQQPTHPTYPSLDRLNTFMNQCYMHEGAVPDVPKPIESGVICAAPMLNGWYRAQIMATYESTDDCDIKYVDYGGYSRVSCSLLKQIRSDFMTLPFEAVECYLANISPLENEQFFSTEAAVVLEELTQGKLLQAQVVGMAEDGIPYVHIYQILGASSAVLVNREMVNRGVVRWIEVMK